MVLSVACNKLCNLVTREVNDFVVIRDEIYKLTMKLKKRHDPTRKHSTSTMVVGDPTLVKIKHASCKKNGTKRRHCSRCRRTRHII